MKAITVLLICLAVDVLAVSLFEKNELSCMEINRPCTLQNVVLESESQLNLVTFPNITDPLVILSGRIPHFTRQLVNKLTGVVDLTANDLQIVTFYIKPEMTHLEATNNQIHTLLVDNDIENPYSMVTLDLTGNKLTNIELISRFKKLKHLILNNNTLEKVSMDIFKGMSEIRTLSLANNQLYSVDSVNSLQLFKLRSLSFAGNQLPDLNVEKWELDALTELDLSNNKLYQLIGNLEQFKSLVNVKISRNYWKCDLLLRIHNIERLTLDHDDNFRCSHDDLIEIKQICCTYDINSILGTDTENGDFELFQDKWEEIRRLNESFNMFTSITVKNSRIIGKADTDEEQTLVERIKKLETQHREMQINLTNQKDSVAIEEISELKKIMSVQKDTIQNFESEQSDFASNLKGLNQSLNSLCDRMSEKFDTLDGVKEKVDKLQESTKDEFQSLQKSIIELKTSFKSLVSQQIKHSMLSLDLKSQIGKERQKINEVLEQRSKLQVENETLRDQMSNVQKQIQVILNILKEMNSVEDLN